MLHEAVLKYSYKAGTVANIRLVMAAALKANAVAIITSHNHQSGNHRPSRAYELLTQKIKTAGMYLNSSDIRPYHCCLQRVL